MPPPAACGSGGASGAALDQQFQVGGTTAVIAEAMSQRMIQPFEAEIACASLVGAIEKRTMMTRLLLDGF
jgi:hypothetical protein